MIEITGIRRKQREVFINPPRQAEPYLALQSLAAYELGYGGQITEIKTAEDLVTVTVVTHVLNCRDTVKFAGSPEEMSVILEFLSCHLAVARSRYENAEGVIKALGGTNNLLIANLGPILVGNNSVLAALCLWAGLESEQQMMLAHQLSSVYNRGAKGLCALIEVIQYIKELGYSFEEVCEGLCHVTSEGVV